MSKTELGPSPCRPYRIRAVENDTALLAYAATYSGYALCPTGRFNVLAYSQAASLLTHRPAAMRMASRRGSQEGRASEPLLSLAVYLRSVQYTVDIRLTQVAVPARRQGAVSGA